MMIDGLCASVC